MVLDTPLPVSYTHLDVYKRQARPRGYRISFSYESSRTAEKVTRTMDLWGLVPERDRIYLVGFDIDRNAPRCFRVIRITDVTAIGTATHPMPAGTNLQELVRQQLRRRSELVDATPVSYTHLDVYKRQLPVFPNW